MFFPYYRTAIKWHRNRTLLWLETINNEISPIVGRKLAAVDLDHVQKDHFWAPSEDDFQVSDVSSPAKPVSSLYWAATALADS